MGVRRAVKIACNQLAYNQLACGKADSPGKIYTLGSLIHNPQTLEDLNNTATQPAQK